MNIRVALRNLTLLHLHRTRHGCPMSPWKLRLLKKLTISNYLNWKRNRLRTLAAHAFERRRRRWHVRPMLKDRKIYGAWYALLPVLREHDPDEYFRFLRMTPECFDLLLEKVSPLITKRSNRESISPGERLAVTLRYLASGDSFNSLSYLFRISNQAIGKIVLETTAVLWFVLKDEVFEPFNAAFWRKKAAEFDSMWNFPMCLGALDGKHCFFQKFRKRGSEHYNYKGSHSVVLFAVADASYKFILVDVGARGRESDGGVFERSEFGKLFASNGLGIPPPVFNEAVQEYLPYVFVGDDAFPLSHNLMKPYQPETVNPEETLYNYRLSRARRAVENAFGILTARFRILRRTTIANETLAQNIILATVALHNLHMMLESSIPPKDRVYSPKGFADVYKSNGVLKLGRWRNKCRQEENSVFARLCTQQRLAHPAGQASAEDPQRDPEHTREKFIELMLADPVPWQWNLLPI